MTESQQKQAIELLRDIHGIHWNREKVRALLSKNENDSYSVVMRKIHEFLKEVDNG